ncbi:MAG TPA: hypothetical protein ENK55_01775 [Actinobacteria bacterium]|nr:hypothetical protein [Actinomycetota bacterium]
MSRAPLVVAVLAGAVGPLWALALALDPGTWAPSSAAAMITGFLGAGALTVTGLALVRAPWGRVAARGTAAAGALVAAVNGFGPATILATAATFVGVAAVEGPWLDLWLRRLPSATGPGRAVFGLLVVALGFLPMLGLVTPGGLRPVDVVAGGLGVLGALAYLRAHGWGLWLLRIPVPAAGLVATWNRPGWSAAAVALGAVAIGAMAWRRDVAARLRPPPPTPAPRRRTGGARP